MGLLSAVRRRGGSGRCMEGAAGLWDVGQREPTPGGRAGGVVGVGRLQHLLRGSQLEQWHLVSLHSQLVQKSALHFPFLVQLQHDGSNSLWRRRSRGLLEATESVEGQGLQMVISG